MIVVTVGTNEQPFDRLVAAVAALGGDEPLLVQHGASRVAPGRGEWVDFLDFDELAERMRGARAVVCHAGVGSIVLARRCGHRPIVVPRRVDRGEAVDDHQLALARRLHADGLVTLVEDERELAAALAAGPRAVEASVARAAMPGAAALSADLHELLVGLGVTPASGDPAVEPAPALSARAA
jgi:UDP-N-acetylglucosamine transferase subunit ALG13